MFTFCCRVGRLGIHEEREDPLCEDDDEGEGVGNCLCEEAPAVGVHVPLDLTVESGQTEHQEYRPEYPEDRRVPAAPQPVHLDDDGHEDPGQRPQDGVEDVHQGARLQGGEEYQIKECEDCESDGEDGGDHVEESVGDADMFSLEERVEHDRGG